MSTLEEDLRLGDLEMGEHTDRLGMVMPYTLVLFALAAFASAIVWIVYAALGGSNLDDWVSHKETLHGQELDEDEADGIKNDYRRSLAYEGAVVGFLIIISYAVVYGALKLSHHHKK